MSAKAATNAATKKMQMVMRRDWVRAFMGGLPKHIKRVAFGMRA